MVANTKIGPAMAASSRDTQVVSKSQFERKLDERIAKLRKSTETVQTEIQSLIVDISKHCVGLGSGDITRAAKLIDALPRWIRRADIIRYWAMFSPVRIVKNTKDEGQLMKANLRKEGDKGYVAWNIPWAEVPENSFFNYIAGLKEPGFLTFEDAEAEVIKLHDRLQARLDNKVHEVPNDMPKEQALSLLTTEEREKNVMAIRERDVNNIRNLLGGLKKLHNQYKPQPVVQQQQTAPEVEEVQRESAAA